MVTPDSIMSLMPRPVVFSVEVRRPENDNLPGYLFFTIRASHGTVTGWIKGDDPDMVDSRALARRVFKDYAKTL